MSEQSGKLPDTTRHLLEDYRNALDEYFQGGGPAALVRAEELGQQVATSGEGVLESARLHHEAMTTILFHTLKSEEEGAEQDAAVVARFCASCPAWRVALEGESDETKDLEGLFVRSLSSAVKDQRVLRRTNTALRHLNEVREQETIRIAHALHSEAAQLLASVHLALEEVAHNMGQPHRDSIREVRKLLDQVEEQLRHLSHELRPTILNDFGLPAALEYLGQGISKRASIDVTIEGPRQERERPGQARLPLLVETALYRFVQEALNNVVRHAKATSVIVRLQHSRQMVCCSVQDDGIGFQVSDVLLKSGDRGLGLMGMQEHLEALSGTLSIDSHPGRGTKLCAGIPLETQDGAGRIDLKADTAGLCQEGRDGVADTSS